MKAIQCQGLGAVDLDEIGGVSCGCEDFVYIYRMNL